MAESIREIGRLVPASLVDMFLSMVLTEYRAFPGLTGLEQRPSEEKLDFGPLSLSLVGENERVVRG